MIIEINIFESKEVDYNPNKQKQKRRTKDEYDLEDSFFENMDYDNEPVELEPRLKNFFVYAGTLPEEPKKVLQQSKTYKQHFKKSEDEINLKIKSTFADEYKIKNEIILRNNKTLNENDVSEYFINQLIIDNNVDVNLIKKQLNVQKIDIDNKYLEILNTKFDIAIIKLKEYVNLNMCNDDFYELLVEVYDLYVRRYYLDHYVNKTKLLVEKTIKKHIKSIVDDIIGEKYEVYKSWSFRMHSYKKRVFFNVNLCYLGSSLAKSELTESK